MEILTIFIHNILKHHLISNINGHSKQQHKICAGSQNSESKTVNKRTQSYKDKEDNMPEISSWTKVTQKFIQSQSLFTHFLSNIVGGLYS